MIQRGDAVFAGEAGYFLQPCETAVAYTETYSAWAHRQWN